MKKYLMLLPALLISCSTLSGILNEKPEVSVKKFDVDAISLRDVTFLFEIELHNPYPVGFRLDDVGFVFKADGTRIFSTRTKKGVTVKAGGNEVTPVQVKLVYEDIMRYIRNYPDRDYLDCQIDIDIIIPLPEAVQSIKKNITFNYTVRKKIPALKPEFRIINVSAAAPSMEEIKKSIAAAGKKNLDPERLFSVFQKLVSGGKPASVVDLASLDVPVSISFEVEVKNGTRAQIRFSDLSYEFFINDVRVLAGTTATAVNEGSRSVMRVTNTFSSKMLGTSVVKMFNSRTGSYRLDGYSNIKFPDEIKSGPLKLEFREKGSFRLK